MLVLILMFCSVRNYESASQRCANIIVKSIIMMCLTERIKLNRYSVGTGACVSLPIRWDEQTEDGSNNRIQDNSKMHRVNTDLVNCS